MNSTYAHTTLGKSEETLEFSKVLFAMGGTKDVKVIEENVAEICNEFPTHNVFTITSKSGALINGKSVKRKAFMEQLKKRIGQAKTGQLARQNFELMGK